MPQVNRSRNEKRHKADYSMAPRRNEMPPHTCDFCNARESVVNQKAIVLTGKRRMEICFLRKRTIYVKGQF